MTPILETPMLRIPRIGLGTWQLRGAEATAAVEGAIALGYRHIDTAAMYGNEEAVGAGIARSGVKREEIHLEVSRRAIKIYGKRDQKALLGTSRYRLAEIPYGYFERSLNLPAGVDGERVEATYRNGLLEVRMAKLPPEGERIQRITISTQGEPNV